MHTFEFARPEVFPVASPDLAATLPVIHHARDLFEIPLLHEDNDLEWQHWFAGQGLETPERLPGSRLWHAHLTLKAAQQGHGVALANSLLLRDDIEAGRLVEIKPAEGQFVPVRFGGYTFIAREDRWNSPAIVRFRRWLQSAALSTEKLHRLE
ncbi:MAG: hypothetical protein IPF97_06355 [Sphingomonadales bacterium]|nr:hypothetical protein [Sphingomonadales bacterium]